MCLVHFHMNIANRVIWNASLNYSLFPSFSPQIATQRPGSLWYWKMSHPDIQASRWLEAPQSHQLTSNYLECFSSSPSNCKVTVNVPAACSINCNPIPLASKHLNVHFTLNQSNCVNRYHLYSFKWTLVLVYSSYFVSFILCRKKLIAPVQWNL